MAPRLKTLVRLQKEGQLMRPKTLIIAEAGVNHNGDFKLAQNLVDVAVDAGADIVKFQTFRSEDVVTPTGAKAAYQVSATKNSRSQLEMPKELELSFEDHGRLKLYCE